MLILLWDFFWLIGISRFYVSKDLKCVLVMGFCLFVFLLLLEEYVLGRFVDLKMMRNIWNELNFGLVKLVKFSLNKLNFGWFIVI